MYNHLYQSTTKYDIIYKTTGHFTLKEHSCVECYFIGQQNPDHGYTFDDAISQIDYWMNGGL